MAALNKAALNDEFSLLLHGGDIAYDMFADANRVSAVRIRSCWCSLLLRIDWVSLLQCYATNNISRALHAWYICIHGTPAHIFPQPLGTTSTRTTFSITLNVLEGE